MCQNMGPVGIGYRSVQVRTMIDLNEPGIHLQTIARIPTVELQSPLGLNADRGLVMNVRKKHTICPTSRLRHSLKYLHHLHI